ncbi:MAG: haloacid dehalogenase [Kaistia sp. SCN 65-12]|nr:MAG: haloacid dehalogenase [Kaistia sp. SCN 65-12]
MVDVDGVLVCGRPSDGRPWASSIEADLGVTVAELQREFFLPYWSEIVVGRQGLAERLQPALARIAPHLACDDFIAYWFENDARLNVELLDELRLQRDAGKKVYLATNQEHLRAAHLVERLGLGRHCDGVYYSAAMGCRKPERAFFERAAALSGFPPEQLLLIDDTSENVAAARASGWKAMEWRDGTSLAAALSGL